MGSNADAVIKAEQLVKISVVSSTERRGNETY